MARDVRELLTFACQGAALGATLDLSLLGAHVTGAVVFSVFVLIGGHREVVDALRDVPGFELIASAGALAWFLSQPPASDLDAVHIR